MATALDTLTELGFDGGVNQDIAQHLIADNEAYYLQDIILDTPGYAARRGSVVAINGFGQPYTIGDRLDGLGSCVRPGGGVSYVALINNNANLTLQFFTEAGNSPGKVLTLLSGTASYADPTYIFDCKAVQQGGTLISVARKYTANGNAARFLIHWRGATKPDYTTGTITCSPVSAVITGSGTTWSTNVEPGQFMFAGAEYLGVVKSVDSNTQITLETPSLYGFGLVGNAYTATSTRGLATIPWASTGSVTAATGSAVVNGGNTAFIDQNVGTAGGASLYAYKQNTLYFLGTVSSVASNTQLTLNANSAQSVTDAQFFIANGVASGQSYSTVAPPLALLSTAWNGMQFLSNRDATDVDGKKQSTTYITNPKVLDAINISQNDGDYFKLPPTSSSNDVITGSFATNNGLVLCRENETFLITGASPSSIKSMRLLDDGCYSSMTMKAWNDGVVWAGRESIYHFDGVQTRDLLRNRARKYYRSLTVDQDLETYRFHGMVENDHYILQMELLNATNPTALTSANVQIFVINLMTGALTFFTGLDMKGSTTVPNFGNVFGHRRAILSSGLTYGWWACSARLLFQPEQTPGTKDMLGYAWYGYSIDFPYLYIETKLFDARSPEVKKTWKQGQFWGKWFNHYYLVTLAGLQKVPVIVSNNAILPDGNDPSLWVNRRVKFRVADTHFGFQLFEASISVLGAIKIGPFALFFKPFRAGRI